MTYSSWFTASYVHDELYLYFYSWEFLFFSMPIISIASEVDYDDLALALTIKCCTVLYLRYSHCVRKCMFVVLRILLNCQFTLTANISLFISVNTYLYGYVTLYPTFFPLQTSILQQQPNCCTYIASLLLWVIYLFEWCIFSSFHIAFTIICTVNSR